MDIALVCCAKREENYLIEFLQHHCSLGVSKVFIIDNNDISYAPSVQDILKQCPDLSQAIEAIDLCGQQDVQLKAYKEIYSKHKGEYDWFCFLDIDELLSIQDNSLSLQTFLSQEKFKSFNQVIIPWNVYDDNNLLYPIDNDFSLEKRFTKLSKDPMSGFKSILRGNLEADVSIHLSHGAQIVSCDPNGNPDPIASYIDKQHKRRYKYIGEKNPAAVIKHYRFKTIYEYIMTKVERGRPCVQEKDYWLSTQDDESLLKIFFQYNDFTEEKHYYGKKLLESLRRMQAQTMNIGIA